MLCNSKGIKFFFFCFMAFSFVGFLSCKEKKQAVVFKDVPEESPVAVEENNSNQIVINEVSQEEIERNRAVSVYDKMSDRFKADVKIDDFDEFVKDLKIVLNEEKKYRADDLPLYYLIDKKHEVSSTYEPKDLLLLTANDHYSLNKDGMYLRPDVEKELRKMADAALEDGIKLLVSSTYRSYEYQTNLFNYWVEVDGLEEAERESARPGTSQHQLGVAIDFGSIDDSFAQTKMGAWMYEHAAEYGWSLSFPKNYEDVTGYRWESWHFRYLGIPAVNFQQKYFNDVQQYMLEYINGWKEAIDLEELEKNTKVEIM